MHALATARRKVRNTITPHPFQDWLARNLPKRLIDRMIDARLGLLPTRQ
jgi:hypothetical protein